MLRKQGPLGQHEDRSNGSNLLYCSKSELTMARGCDPTVHDDPFTGLVSGVGDIGGVRLGLRPVTGLRVRLKGVGQREQKLCAVAPPRAAVHASQCCGFERGESGQHC